MNLLNYNYRYFRKITNIVDELSLFVIQKEINPDVYSYIYFLHNETIPIDELNNIINQKQVNFISLLETVLDFNEKIVGITSIQTNLYHRNKGYASLLIIISCVVAERFGLDTIELDDDSDNFKKQKNRRFNFRRIRKCSYFI